MTMDTSSNLIRNRAELCNKIFGEPESATDERLSHDVYRCTACGGWCRTTDNGVQIGTIVEGSDAEFYDSLVYPFTVGDWDSAWEEIEHLAEEAWEEANSETESEEFI